MKESAAIAEFATMLAVAVLGVGAGASAWLVPAATLGAIYATLRGRDENRILAKAVEASVTALSNGSEFSADDIITAQGWIATQDLSFTLHPAKIAAARGDVAKVLDAALADATIPPDATTRTILRCALQAAYDCCRSFDDFHQRFTQDMLVQIAQDHWQTRADLSVIKEDSAETKAMVQQLLALVKADQPERLVQNEKLIIGLARNYSKGNDPHLDDAYRGLQAALQEYDKMRAANALPHNADAHLDAVLQRVQALNDAARFADARAALAQARAEQADRMAEAASGMQRLWDQTVSQARLENDPDLAADALVERLKLDQPADLFDALRDLRREWYIRNRDFGLPFDGHVAIALARATLAHAQGTRQAGAAQNDLGIALQTLGARAGDGALLQQAVDVYRAALQVYTQAETPVAWATTQNNLGIALATLGARAGDGALLEQAVDAYRAALQVYTQAETPLDWAMTQNNLGAALQTLGARSGDGALLQQAVDAFRAALQVRTQADTPLVWANTQNNLGNALGDLGALSGDGALLEQAVDAFRAALQVYTQADTPLDWAMTQNNLGNVLQTLGARSGDGALLEQAVDAYRAALQVRTQADTPLAWAMTQNNLGNALATLGALSGDGALLQQAVDAFRAALQVRTQADLPVAWAMTQNNLGNTLRTLGALSGDGALLEQAVDAFRAALQVRTQTDTPVAWANTTENLAILDLAFHDLDPDPRHLVSARERALAARAVFERIGAEYDLGRVDDLLSDIAARSAA